MSYPILDADGHVTESSEGLARYLDEPFRRRPLNFPLVPQDGWDRRMLGTLGQTASSPDEWLQAMDKGGMDTAVLFPTLGLFMSFLRDRAWAVALCRAYNTLLAEEFTGKTPRLKAVALLPVQDPEAAARELTRAVTELGMVGAMLAADGGHVLGDPKFLPIYEEAQRLDTCVAIHASGSHLGGAGVDLFPTFIQTHTCSHAFGQMRQLTSIVFEGIPERFPRLRIAFLEAGCGWAPYWIERMDDEFAKRQAEAPALKKKPSDYVRGGNIYFSCEADEWLLPQAVKLVGESQIVYASDFPHWDNSYPGSLDEIRNRGDITDTQKRKILSDNTRRLYRI
ncbi:MAG: amidohydrolase [Candidatus Rokubacteria bacterium]|nr:amidohydrolase [Candidatus Rokubacteria bacterium]MBI3825087.1 amidohydrolase [Candidatus Rokubacteria bacterium]